jgi:glycosyltransferase involved in cell wall biosynthesis
LTRAARVLSVIDSLGAGGAERHLVNLSRALRDGPFPTDVYVLHGRDAVYEGDMRAAGGEVVVGARSRRGVVSACLGLRRMIRRGRYEIVHTYLPASTLLGTLIARSCGVARVMTTVVARREQLPSGPLGFSNYRRLARWIDLYLTPYPGQLVDLGGIPAAKIRFTRLALDATTTPSADADETPPWFARLDGAFPVIVGVGRLHPDKGHDLAIRALAALRARHPGAKLVVMGVGDEHDALRALAAELGLADHVIFGGFMRNLAPLLRRAHVYVKSSVNEGANMAILQAMGAGVPCVAFETKDMEYEGPEFRECAVFAALRDVDALSAAMSTVLDDRAAARRVTENGARYVRALDPAEVVRSVERAYQDCLDGKSA